MSAHNRAFLAVAIAGLTFPVTRSPQRPAALEGVVLEETTNEPMPGVRVSLIRESATRTLFDAVTNSDPPAEKSVVTNNQGRFVFEDAGPGRYRLLPATDGYVISQPTRRKSTRYPGIWTEVVAGGPVTGIQMRMVREGLLSGQVLDSNGQPASGNVQIRRYVYDEDGRRQLRTIPGIPYSIWRLNDRGEYRFHSLPAGEYYLLFPGSNLSGRPTTYYPGVTDEKLAKPILVEAGQEVRLNALVPVELKGAPLRLRLANRDPEAIGYRILMSGADLQHNSFRDDTIEFESVIPGRHDMLILVGNSYARTTIDIGSTAVHQEISLARSARVQIRGFMQEESGRQFPADVGCVFRSPTASFFCVVLRGSTYVQGLANIGAYIVANQAPTVPGGTYRLDLRNLPKDAYVVSATLDGRDIIRDGVQIVGDAQMDIVLRSPGGIVTGTVRDAKGAMKPDAVVALVPDAPLRDAGILYRSSVSDVRGKFELRGVAPGDYRLFAWSDIEGAAFRNAEFMKAFEEAGKSVRIEKLESFSVDVTLSEKD